MHRNEDPETMGGAVAGATGAAAAAAVGLAALGPIGAVIGLLAGAAGGWWGGHEMTRAVQDVDRFWRFIPASMRPELLEARFTLDATYASAAAFDAASTTGGISGSIGADLKFRLPAFPADTAGLFTITSGGEDGIIEAHLELGVDALGNPTMEMSLSDLVAVEIQLPGLPQPQPPDEFGLLKVKPEPWKVVT